MSDDGPERRQGYRHLGERVAAVETEMRTNTTELSRVRVVVHDMVSHLAALVGQSEMQQRDHATQARQIDDLRADLKERFEHLVGTVEQHDLRDDQRFAGHGSQIATIERTLGIQAAQDDEQHRKQAKRLAVYVAIIGLGSGIVSAVAGIAIAALTGVRP
jgi:chromosome segregation ATPase